MGLTDKQMGYMNYRMGNYIRQVGYDLVEFEKWAKEGLDTFTLNNLLKDIENYESDWDEKHMRSFKGQIKELYENR